MKTVQRPPAAADGCCVGVDAHVAELCTGTLHRLHQPVVEDVIERHGRPGLHPRLHVIVAVLLPLHDLVLLVLERGELLDRQRPPRRCREQHASRR